MTLKVYIIDQLNLVREGLSALLSDYKDIEVTGMASDYASGKDAIADCDVLLIEHDQEIEQSVNRVQEIRQLAPAVKILLLSERPEGPAFINRMLGAGISGYMTKFAGAEELYYGIKKVSEEGIYICTAFILKFLETQYTASYEDPKLADTIELSKGESEVLELISQGLTNKEIAHQLFVSVRTVEARRVKLLEKTNTTNTATLIKFCLRAGLIK